MSGMKLKLNKETLRLLSDSAASQVVGGTSDQPSCGNRLPEYCTAGACTAGNTHCTGGTCASTCRC